MHYSSILSNGLVLNQKGVWLRASIVWLFIFFTHFLNAQQPTIRTELTFPKIDENSFAYTDTTGFLWLGAYNGLFRFDGTNLLKVNINDPDSEVRHGQNVQSDIFPAADGKLWFTTYEALHTYHPVTGEVRTFVLTVDEKIISEDYRAIYLDKSSDVLWLKAKDRIVGFNTDSEIVEHLGPTTQGNFFATGQNKSGNQVALGMPWYSAENIEVFTLDVLAQTWSKTVVKEPARFVNGEYIRPGLFYVGGVYGLYLLELDQDQANLSKVLTPELPNSTLYDVHYDSLSKSLLLNFTKQGVINYNLSTNALVYQVNNGDRSFATLWSDKKGHHWLSTGKGFKVVEPTPTPKNSPFTLLSATAYSQVSSGGIVLKDEEGRAAWVSPDILLEDTHCWLQADLKGKSFPGYQDTLFSLYSSTLQVFDKQSESLSTYRFIRGLGRGITNFGRGKTLAITQARIGWLKLAADSARIDPLRGSSIFPAGQDYTFLRRLNQETVAVVAGATRLYFANYRQERLVLIDSVSLGAEIQDVAVHPDKPETYFIGTNTGLYRYTRGKLEGIRLNSSLENSHAVYAMSFDDAGILWLGTTNGLIAYDGTNTICYNSIDGLPEDLVFNPDQVVRDPRGRLLFSTNHGLLLVNPNNINPSTTKAEPYISQLWINKAESTQLSALSATQALNIDYRENDLSLRIQAAAGIMPWETFSFSAHLTGPQTSEKTITNGGVLHYDNLRWGKYELLIKAFNHHGLSVGKSSYTITIAPPFYHTWWFRLLAILTIGGGLYLFHYTLVRKAIAEQVRLREIQESITNERDRIAEEVHDDLGGQISSIMFLTQSLMLKPEAKSSLPNEINRINELSRNSLQNVRDIIFTLDAHRSTLDDLFVQLENVGRETFADHQLEFTATADLPHGQLILNSKEKRNLTLLVKEAFHNIIKHAGANNVSLSLSQPDPQSYRLCVEDDGVGIANKQSEEQPERISFGLQNMKRKCKEMGAALKITTITPSGTQVLVSGRIKPNKT